MFITLPPGASPDLHLKANTASLKYNWSLAGNQFNVLAERYALQKICTNWDLFTFLAVLDQTLEQ